MNHVQEYTPAGEFELGSDGRNYIIKKYNGRRQCVVIPPVINGRKVAKIGTYAFNRRETVGFLDTRDISTVETVIIPDTVTEIDAYAFYLCEKLHTVIAHPNISEIGEFAFCGCENLKIMDFGVGETVPNAVTFPRSLKKLQPDSIAVNAFCDTCLFAEVSIHRRTRVPKWNSHMFDNGCCLFYYDD